MYTFVVKVGCTGQKFAKFCHQDPLLPGVNKKGLKPLIST